MNHLRTLFSEARSVLKLLPRAPRFRPSAAWSPARALDEYASKAPDALGIAYLDERYTWREVDSHVNRYANALRKMGVRSGDTVALLMDNRPEFLFVFQACSRLRAISALINTNISGNALIHALQASKATHAIVGVEHAESCRAVVSELDELSDADIVAVADRCDQSCAGFRSFDELSSAVPESRPESIESPTGNDIMCYIYTSGTTGLPKAVILRNRKFMMAGSTFGRVLLQQSVGDRIYVALPLYHSIALLGGWAGALNTGAAIAIRRKFSASEFWDDVRKFEATGFLYIGELCRYLLNQPAQPNDREHCLRAISGNGLRPDVWGEFQERFEIPVIREFYGATEGNAMTVNLVGRAGMIGRRLPGMSIVKCDLETGELRRDAHGFAEEVRAGETGLLIAKIAAGIADFDGYMDEEATKKKMLSDVFKKGDRYFDTGDLIGLHENSWLSFADRIGDTFRWKGENVSTNEVAEALNAANGVLETSVYGVEIPGAEGRAGMASVRCDESFDMDAFSGHVMKNLPSYQRPIFVRLQNEIEITGTFKHQKSSYRREGYDPALVEDPLYFLDDEKYVPFDTQTHTQLTNGAISVCGSSRATLDLSWASSGRR